MFRIIVLCLAGLTVLSACEEEQEPEKVAYSGLKYTGKAHQPPPEPTATATASSDEGGNGSGISYKGGGSNRSGSKSFSSANIDACCGALNAQAATRSGKDKERSKTAARLCVNLAHQVRKGKVSSQNAFMQLRSSTSGRLPSACMR